MPQPLRIDLDVLLPHVPDTRDTCVQRLTETLAAQPGVGKVHILEEAGKPPRLCLHYDPAVLPMPRLRQKAEAVGAELSARYGHFDAPLDATLAPRRARALAERMRKAPGVLEAEAGPGQLRVEFDTTVTHADALRRLVPLPADPSADAPLEKAASHSSPAHEHPPNAHGPDDGHAPRKHGPDDGHDHRKHAPGDGHNHAHGGGKRELAFALLAGASVLIGWLLERYAPGVPEIVPTGLYLAGMGFGGFFTAREAWEAIRAGRFEIDFLMLVSATGAALLGEYFEGALLLFLFSLGHSLESYAMGRARRAIEALSDLAPDTATVRWADGREETVPVEQLALGDRVVVKPNERLPADGVVVAGTSAVNQAPVTGESLPADKQPITGGVEAALQAGDGAPKESRVFAGTINGTGVLEVVVSRLASESTLARVAQLVASAQTQPSPTQRFTDRFERIFVPSVLGFVGLLFCAPLVTGEPFADAAYRALAVLVAASPCALAIATPSAVLSGVARAGRGGVLVKGGAPLEALGSLEAIAFDKTGTITKGEPHLTDVEPAEGVEAGDLLATTLAVERLSDHPLARAIVQDAATWNTASPVQPRAAEDLSSITGRGVVATVDGQKVYIGKTVLFDEVDGEKPPQAVRDTAARLEANGRTTMVVRQGNRYLGVLGVMDTPRNTAADVIQRLRTLGIRKMVMLSGDNGRVASAVAKSVGLDEAYGDLMPQDKVVTVRELAQQGGVAMVGDGVNDAPALAAATVGIAMGAAGSDVALETADVALMADDLHALPFAVGLSRQVRGIVRQNLWMSLGMVAFLIPATLLGLKMGPVVALHEGSTLVVVFNALRLLAYRDPS